VIDKFNPWLHEYYARFTAGRGDQTVRSVVFVIGSPDISGGTYVIFQHALWLKQKGIEVTIVPHFPMSVAEPDWHPAMNELRFASFEDVKSESFDIAVVTWWPTVYDLPRLRFRHAVYFIQSAESRFYADGDESQASAMAELTYTFGLPVITIATWLQLYMAFQHNAPSFLVRNGIDKTHFGVEGKTKAPPLDEGLRILIEGTVDVPMKGVNEAIEVAIEAGCEEVWLLTSSDLRVYPGCDRVYSRIPGSEVAEIYRSCDALLKLTHVEGMFGPPLEMFHCGGTVVTYDVTGHDEYVEHEQNGLVVPVGDKDAAVREVRRLREDSSLLSRLREGALETADRWPDWEEASSQFGRLLDGVNRQPPPENLHTMLSISGAWSVDEMVQRGD